MNRLSNSLGPLALLLVSLLSGAANVDAQISWDDAERLYNYMKLLETGFEESYTKPGKIIQVGVYHADTGEFEHWLPQEEQDLPFVPYHPFEPYLPQGLRIWDEDIWEEGGIYFEMPIFGLDDPMVFTQTKPIFGQTPLKFHIADHGLSVKPDTDSVIRPDTPFVLPLTGGKMPLFKIVDPCEAATLEKLPLELDQEHQELWPWPVPDDLLRYRYARALKLGRTLRFEIRNHERPVYFRIVDIRARATDGRTVRVGKTLTAKAEVGQDSIDIWVGPAVSLCWQLVYGADRVCDRIVIRPRVEYEGIDDKCIFGVFELKALPLCIIYEPPQTSEGKNEASYERKMWQMIRWTYEITDEESKTRPGKAKANHAGTFADVLEFAAGLSIVKEIPRLGDALDALEALFDALDESTETKTVEGSEITQGYDNAFGLGRDQSWTTSRHTGPGRGDVFVVLKRPRFAWIGVEGQPENVSLMYLGSKAELTVAAEDLLDELANHTNQFGLDEETIHQLLALDPLVTDPTADHLYGFELVRTFEHSGNEQDYGGSVEIKEADELSKTTFESTTINHRPGALQAWFYGDKPYTLKTKHKISAHTAASAGKEITARVTLYDDPEGPYAVNVYYHRTFGSFAFTRGEICDATGDPPISGLALGHEAQPLPDTLVKLTINGRKYSTYTDSNGNFSFRSTSIKPGSAVITVGNTKKSLHLGASPVKDIIIHTS